MTVEQAEIAVKGGWVVDPYAGVNAIGTVGIRGSRSLGMLPANAGGRIEIDASGCYVFPGLIDFHTHVYDRGSSLCVDPNSFLSMGVTTTVDAGTTGCGNFRTFYSSVIAHSSLRILAYLNVCSYGQPGDGFEDNLHPEFYREEKIQALIEEFPQQVKGLKIRMSKELLDGQGLQPLLRAKEMARRLGCPMVVHASNPPVSEDELALCLDRGDVLCHCFHGKGMTILGQNGRLLPGIQAARERGVLFDSANGSTNYNHAVAKQAISEGFFPDIISTDMCSDIFNREGLGKNLPFVMSKYLCLGLPLVKAVQAVTAAPAQVLGLAGELGTLAKGAQGDLTICRLRDAAPVFLDNEGKAMQGDRLLIPVLTIKGGRILYRQTDF